MARTLLRGLSIGGACAAILAPFSSAQSPPAASSTQTPSAQVVLLRPDLVVLQALLQNPITAPYRITTTTRGAQVVLSGRVGTKQVHDTAVQVAIATGISIRDDLVIDTIEAHRLAASAAAGAPGMSSPYYTPSLGASPYVYPRPLFGRLDDPFYGYEPPLVSYPPWWRGVTTREPITLGMPQPGAPVPVATPNGGGPGSLPPGLPYQDGTIEMTLNSRGVAVLRGTVPTLADRVAVGQKVAQMPGVTEVINSLSVSATATQVPPPPQPGLGGPARPPAGPQPALVEEQAPAKPVAVDRGDVASRAVQGIERNPALAALPLKVSVREGVAFLSGKVPSVYEAMLAFRAVQQTPGVRQVDDGLEFTVPDGEKPNPLQVKGRPEDVEPYILAQIQRQVGDLAHVDQVRLLGDALEIRGTLVRQDDRPRLEAVLNSMPILRGFRLSPLFVAD